MTISPGEFCVKLRDKMQLRLLEIDFGDLLKAEEIRESHLIVTPGKLAKTRDAVHRSKIKTLQKVNVVFVGRIEMETDKYKWLAAVSKMMDDFLHEGGLMCKDYQWPCMATETLTGAESGYSEDSLRDTPDIFLGGFQATFWLD